MLQHPKIQCSSLPLLVQFMYLVKKCRAQHAMHFAAPSHTHTRKLPFVSQQPTFWLYGATRLRNYFFAKKKHWTKLTPSLLLFALSWHRRTRTQTQRCSSPRICRGEKLQQKKTRENRSSFRCRFRVGSAIDRGNRLWEPFFHYYSGGCPWTGGEIVD